MRILLLILLWASFVVSLDNSILPLSRLVPGITKFTWNDPNTNANVDFVFRGLTIDGNLVLVDSVNNAVIFQKPNSRTNGPDDPAFGDFWYALTVDETTLVDLSDPSGLFPNDPKFVSIYGSVPNALIDATVDEYNAFMLVLEHLILRGISMKEVLQELAVQEGTIYPLAVVGGCVRDFKTSDINGINDIDVCLSQDYTQIAYRLKDIFVDWNQPIDSSVLDSSGIRKQYGLLKVRKNSHPELPCDRDSDPTSDCYGDGLDIGPFKGPVWKQDTKKYVSGNSISREEEINHYLYGYSYNVDAKSRDFTVNCIYYEPFSFPYGKFIDPTGNGIADSEQHPPVLRIADSDENCDSSCNWELDVGGWFRFWRFIASPDSVVDGKGYVYRPQNVAYDRVCPNMLRTTRNLLFPANKGRDPHTGYNVHGYFLKFLKKRKFTLENMNQILDSMAAQMYDFGGNCADAWDSMVELSANSITLKWIHLLDGDSAENRLLGSLIDNLAARFTSTGTVALRPSYIFQNNPSPLSLTLQKSTSSFNSPTTDRLISFACFMQKYVLGGANSYSSSQLVSDPVVSDEDIYNPVSLEDNFYDFQPSFEEEPLPSKPFRYPSWTDLRIYANDSANPVYVHKILLLVGYSAISELSPTSELSMFVQLMLNGDYNALHLRLLQLTDTNYVTLVNQLSLLYDSTNYSSLLFSLAQWWGNVRASNSTVVQNQHAALFTTPVKTIEGRVFVSRFVIASYGSVEVINKFSLLTYESTLQWLLISENGAVSQPTTETINLYLDTIFGLPVTPTPELQQLLNRAENGTSFCYYEIPTSSACTIVECCFSLLMILLVCFI